MGERRSVRLGNAEEKRRSQRVPCVPREARRAHGIILKKKKTERAKEKNREGKWEVGRGSREGESWRSAQGVNTTRAGGEGGLFKEGADFSFARVKKCIGRKGTLRGGGGHEKKYSKVNRPQAFA
jgi:hypothetical protein